MIRIGEVTPQGLAIPIRDARYPSPFASGLEYSPLPGGPGTSSIPAC